MMLYDLLFKRDVRLHGVNDTRFLLSSIFGIQEHRMVGALQK